ncbi:MAG: thrombospondin type 3 repeat-containing protein [Alphaproteobacteria bacterium]|nr:thrombospondin type 3 repeat-containing protein [Alphaproteobacteria bacterium]
MLLGLALLGLAQPSLAADCNDYDRDGVCWELDLCWGDDATRDVDGDGVCGDLDPCEDARVGDADGDGRCIPTECVGDDASGNTDGDRYCDDIDGCDGDHVVIGSTENGELWQPWIHLPHGTVPRDLDGQPDEAVYLRTGDTITVDLEDGYPTQLGTIYAADVPAVIAVGFGDHLPAIHRLEPVSPHSLAIDLTGLSQGNTPEATLTVLGGELWIYRVRRSTPGPAHFGLDLDHDGRCDATPDDPCFGTGPDSDGDGYCDDQDTCSGDSTTGDADLDGICDSSDGCWGDNSQGNADSDAWCDADDPCIGWPASYTVVEDQIRLGLDDASFTTSPGVTFGTTDEGVDYARVEPGAWVAWDIDARAPEILTLPTPGPTRVRAWIDGVPSELRTETHVYDAHELMAPTYRWLPPGTHHVEIQVLSTPIRLTGIRERADTYAVDPATNPDLDGDGYCDFGCIGWGVDHDGDGRCGSREICEGPDTQFDGDQDGFCGNLDSCTGAANGQDADGDQLCDDLDPCTSPPGSAPVQASWSGSVLGGGVLDGVGATLPPGAVLSITRPDISSVQIRKLDDTPIEVRLSVPGLPDRIVVYRDAGIYFPFMNLPPGHETVAFEALQGVAELDVLSVRAWLGQVDGDDDGICDSIDMCLGDDATGDADGDGVCDDLDQCVGDDATGDVDGDGLCGDVDPCLGENATGDTDGDGVCDDRDVCLGDDGFGDGDADGICDDLDVCLGDDASGDTDGDGVCDDEDPCPLDAPPDDFDGDGVCDSDDQCLGDDTFPDTDGDRICEDIDRCLGHDNTGDIDDDGVCGDLDPCFGDNATGDADGDGLCGDRDLCFGANATLDLDGDGICGDRDVCEGDDASGDTDGDGLCDDTDPCVGPPSLVEITPATDWDMGDAGITITAGGTSVPPFAADLGFTHLVAAMTLTGWQNAALDLDLMPANPSVTTYVRVRIDTPTGTPAFETAIPPTGTPTPLTVRVASDLAPGGHTIYIQTTSSIFMGRVHADADLGPDFDNDADGDGLCDTIDACPEGNDAVDADGDGTPDACDLCPLDSADDSDGDGVCDSDDACPGGDDALDTDGDGTADACDACPLDLYNDSDGDGSCDGDDACPLDPDDDADGDGLCGDVDVCPLDPENDLDGDGVCGDVDPCPLDAFNDADGDGICGNVDSCPGGDDGADMDGDGTPDFCDVCPLDADNDADGDGACGDVDPCPADAADDSDGDGSCDSDDLCPLDPDDDLDADGVCGDIDPCPYDPENDADGDGLCEIDDNCPMLANADQADHDGDGVGDACEPDADGDGVVDDLDNCPFAPNPDQADLDGDGVGDVCDSPDGDLDGVPDVVDACADTPLGEAVDGEGCSVDQRCPCDQAWKNHGAYRSCVAHVLEDLVDTGALTEDEADAIGSAAGQSSCGKRR